MTYHYADYLDRRGCEYNPAPADAHEGNELPLDLARAAYQVLANIPRHQQHDGNALFARVRDELSRGLGDPSSAAALEAARMFLALIEARGGSAGEAAEAVLAEAEDGLERVRLVLGEAQ